MLDFLQNIVDAISVAFDTLVNFVSGIVQLVKMLPQAVLFVSNASGYLPTFIVGFITAGVFISVIFMIVGRSGSGD